MKSPTESTSPVRPWYLDAFFGSLDRDKPVETGSMKTRSVLSRMENGFSLTLIGGSRAVVPSGDVGTILGPRAPRWSQTADEPGPPLKAKVIGRLVASVTSFLM